MNENELTPEPESNEPAASDADLSADDSTLILHKPAEDSDTLILPKVAASDETEDEVVAHEDTYFEVSSEAETKVDLPAGIEDSPAAVSLPAEDWNLGDIDAALAAVASLSEMMPDREAEAQARADAKQGKPTFVPEMKMPPLATLKRGQLGSIVPALLLIGFGAWLTLTTTSGTPPAPLLVAGVIVGGVVLSLLAQWLGTGRWSRGALFFALLVLLFAGVIVYSVQPNGIDLLRGWPLLIVALGLAIVLAGLLARPFNARLLAPGALTVLAGVIALVETLGLTPVRWTVIAAPLAPVMLIIVLIVWMLPLVFRRRRS